ncbi:MAG: histidine phosphatase family protein [Betaproteobacteria bacterium HGW-Betaproteobacteria-21]|nr:MAG: histidine phosphatase family protein [Betaproteobacteria bacterium HGW-Betaproteobacteria-21]
MKILFACLLWMFALPAAIADDALWSALRSGGHIALMRHALAPGVGDPPGFRVDDCSTQRNLSAQGRQQARASGERFRAHGITRAAVHSSRWCRCLETATLLGLGPVTPFAALDSLFPDRSLEAARSEEVRALIRAHGSLDVPLVLVTHQANITPLSGIFPASGEIIVLRVDGDEITVAGRISPPAAGR